MSVGDIVRFIRTWSTTGAIAPSGRALARRMVAHVDPAASEPVLELGPGTGVVTRALMEEHYDPAYDRSRKAHGPQASMRIPLEGMDNGSLEKTASDILAKVNRVP